MMITLRHSAFMFAFLAIGCMAAQAAYIVQPNGGKGSDNFSAPFGIGGASTPAGAGTLAALGLTGGVPSIYGGSEYRFEYTPGVDGDNATFAKGDRRNQYATFVSSGLSANSTNRYRVFRVHPQTDNVTGGLTNYEILVNGTPAGISQSIDQNLIDIPTGLATGANIGLWELLGEVTISAPSDVITVVQSPTTATFVSMRSGGILFEAIPEPTTSVLLLVTAATIASIRRRWC